MTYLTNSCSEPKILISLITIVGEVIEQTHETTRFVLESQPGADVLRKKLGDIDQSVSGIRRRLDEVTRQVDQA
jgi:hypothetical protein